jgi:hypoxanthine phosphoribosyltransferase
VSTLCGYDDTDGEVLTPLLREQVIAGRIKELGELIATDYNSNTLVIIGLLKGASIFTTDLVREIARPLHMDWISVSTYGMGTIAGSPRIQKKASFALVGRNVIVVDDILDTGVTLNRVTKHLRKQSPASLETCVLLRKPSLLPRPITPKYVGFDITSDWVAGYGIDYKEKYRHLREIHDVKIL